MVIKKYLAGLLRTFKMLMRGVLVPGVSVSMPILSLLLNVASKIGQNAWSSYLRSLKSK